MQVPKSLTPALLFAILVHQIMIGPSEHYRPDMMGSVVKSAAAESSAVSPAPAKKTTIKRLANKLDIHHVRNSSYHLDDAASYYHNKQQSLIKALRSKGMK